MGVGQQRRNGNLRIGGRANLLNTGARTASPFRVERTSCLMMIAVTSLRTISYVRFIVTPQAVL